MSKRDPLRLEENQPDPFRFLMLAAVLFILVAVLIAVCTTVIPP